MDASTEAAEASVEAVEASMQAMDASMEAFIVLGIFHESFHGSFHLFHGIVSFFGGSCFHKSRKYKKSFHGLSGVLPRKPSQISWKHLSWKLLPPSVGAL